MKTYLLLERINKELTTVPPDATARYNYCWAQAAELTEALLDDIEATVQMRGYVQDVRVWLNPYKWFSKGEFFLILCFDPKDQFSMKCQCLVGGESGVRLQVLDQAEGRHLQRIAKLLAGPSFDNTWFELTNLKSS